MINLTVILITALAIELVTIIVRFVFKISSKEIYIKIMKRFKLKKFYHFHHLIWGVIIALIFYPNEFLFSLGIGIFLSDIVHHFIVLWIIVGNPEFHLVYKNIKEFREEEAMERRRIRRFFRHIIHHA